MNALRPAQGSVTHTALLTQIANELPALLRQVASGRADLHVAGILRLQELCDLTAPFRAAPAHRSSRRSLLQAAVGGTFAAWASKDD